MLLSGINNIETYSKWFCATELYAIKRNMLIAGMQLSGVDCISFFVALYMCLDKPNTCENFRLVKYCELCWCTYFNSSEKQYNLHLFCDSCIRYLYEVSKKQEENCQ